MAASYDGCEISLENWTKFNERRDVKRPSWVRFEHDFFEAPDFFDFSPQERLAWVYILCCASKKSGTFTVSYSHALRIGEIDTRAMTGAIEKLLKKRTVRVSGTDTPAHGTDTPATNERTDETDERTHATREGQKAGLSGIEVCKKEWIATLQHFGVVRPLGERDEVALARGIMNFGEEWVRLALAGARKQVKGPKFDPANFVSLAIYLHKENVERYVNLGSGKATSDGTDWNYVLGKAEKSAGGEK